VQRCRIGVAIIFDEGALVQYEDQNGNLIEGVVHLGEYFYRTELEETRHYGYFVENQSVITKNGTKLLYRKLHHTNGALPNEWKNVSEIRAIISVLDYEIENIN